MTMNEQTTVTQTTQMTGECNFGLHRHCPGASFYGGHGGANLLEMWAMELPCQCECHRRERTLTTLRIAQRKA